MRILFALTMFVSAALLFAVQPMFARLVLPRLGGAPAVWNTCMVFYQAALLGGYVYAHLATRGLGPRRHAALHLGLMALPWLVLPLAVPAGWTPPTETTPVFALLGLLATTVGLPFFVVSASAPLLQAWFAETDDPAAADPYFLYSASNLGSLLALLSYPLVVERYSTLHLQTRAWSAGYAVLTVLIGLCAVVLWRTRPKPAAVAVAGSLDPHAALPPRVWNRLHWLALAAVPSSLLLGVTTHISTDVAADPFLWVVPFALYLLSFVLVFARRVLLPRAVWVEIEPVCVLVLALWFLLFATRINGIILRLHLGTFFVIAMVCHGELAARRPAAQYLTEFYLCMSLGGVLGGLFNALLAPALFQSVLEYPLALVAACALRPVVPPGTLLGMRVRWPWEGWGPAWWGRCRAWTARWAWALDLLGPALLAGLLWGLAMAEKRLPHPSWLKQPEVWLLGLGALLCLAFRNRPMRFALGVASIIGFAILLRPEGEVLYRTRNFFGVVRVMKYYWPQELNELVNGTINHGEQFCDPEARRKPLSYYHRKGPLGQLFEAREHSRPWKHLAAIGLGTGTIAAYGQPGRSITFYEINPAIQRIAEDPALFTYLSDCAEPPEIVLGDARLTLAGAPSAHYDVLVLDAYSSDSIPIHLVTREALQLYLVKLAPHGVLALHVSNRYFDLESVVGRLTQDAGLASRMQVDDEDEEDGKAASHWMIATRDVADLGPLATDARWRPVKIRPKTPLWTDDYADVWGAMDAW